jgi:cytochrome c oxidase accessory protein FixG
VVAFLTAVLWFCFGYFREQFCIIMCPYGRLQSALTDDNTVNIGYDEKRGEPRGAVGKAEGDCVDCRRCIQVCPTGIDIRNGLQLECIGCAACIDACDDIMVKVGRPKGLVRYDSQAGFSGEKRRVLRPRIYIYTALAALGMAALSLVAYMKMSPFTTTISRVGGTGFSVDANSVRNIYLLRVQNKRNQPATLTIHMAPELAAAGYQLSGENQTFSIEPLGELTRTCVVLVPLESYRGPGEIALEVRAEPGGIKLRKTTRFMGPNPNAVRPPAP